MKLFFEVGYFFLVYMLMIYKKMDKLRENCSDNFISYQLELVHDMIQHGNYEYALELYREIGSQKVEYKQFESALAFRVKHGHWNKKQLCNN